MRIGRQGKCGRESHPWERCRGRPAVLRQLLERHEVDSSLHLVGRDEVASPALELKEEIAGEHAGPTVERARCIDVCPGRHGRIGHDLAFESRKMSSTRACNKAYNLGDTGTHIMLSPSLGLHRGNDRKVRRTATCQEAEPHRTARMTSRAGRYPHHHGLPFTGASRRMHGEITACVFRSNTTKT